MPPDQPFASLCLDCFIYKMGPMPTPDGNGVTHVCCLQQPPNTEQMCPHFSFIKTTSIYIFHGAFSGSEHSFMLKSLRLRHSNRYSLSFVLFFFFFSSFVWLFSLCLFELSNKTLQNAVLSLPFTQISDFDTSYGAHLILTCILASSFPGE